jgi:hypothetical protein
MGEKRGWRRRLLGKKSREEVFRCSTYLHHLHSCGSRVAVSARDDLHREMHNMQSRTNHFMDLRVGANHHNRAICTEVRRGV